jgi:hypothetical protein
MSHTAGDGHVPAQPTAAAPARRSAENTSAKAPSPSHRSAALSSPTSGAPHTRHSLERSAERAARNPGGRASQRGRIADRDERRPAAVSTLMLVVWSGPYALAAGPTYLGRGSRPPVAWRTRRLPTRQKRWDAGAA